MEILREITPTAPKYMVYGLPGSGKTTFASKLPKSLILDLEGGSSFIKTPRTPQITNIEKFFECLVELWKAPEREFDCIVIDSIDWLVRLIIEQVAGINKNNLSETLNRSNGGYGNGKQILENHVRTKLLPMLVALNKKGYSICLLAHADRKSLMDAEGFDVEKISPKIDPTTLNAFIEWCDAIYYLKSDDDGKRTIQVSSTSNITAKNRFGLQGEFDLADTDIMDLLNFNEEEE